jgi:hypothetical protein
LVLAGWLTDWLMQPGYSLPMDWSMQRSLPVWQHLTEQKYRLVYRLVQKSMALLPLEQRAL